MEFKGLITNVGRNYRTGKVEITFATDDNIFGGANDLFDRDLRVTAKTWRAKRSLDANAYAWVLIDKLAKMFRMSKTDVYRSFICEVGGNSETVCVKADKADAIARGWRHNGLGWITERSNSKIKGCVNLTLYMGSSEFDTEQMSRFIELIIQECEAQGIDTRTPQEIAQMLDMWGEKTVPAF